MAKHGAAQVIVMGICILGAALLPAQTPPEANGPMPGANAEESVKSGEQPMMGGQQPGRASPEAMMGSRAGMMGSQGMMGGRGDMMGSMPMCVCPASALHGPLGIVAAVVTTLLALSVSAVLIALTIYLLRRSRQIAAI